MSRDKSLVIRIEGDSRDLQKEFKKIKGETKQLQDNLSSIAKKSAVGFVALTAAIVGVTKAFRADEQAAFQTKAILKATGFAAGVTADEITELSTALQDQTIFSDSAVQSAANMLLTFKNLGKNIFPQATEAVLDMATVLGTDAKQSAIQLGKALNDPILGVTALSRVGIQFTEQQREQIRTLVESNRVFEAQKIILGEVQGQMSGVAKAASGGTGVLVQLANAFGNLSSKVGENVFGVLEPFAKALLKIFRDIRDGNPAILKFASNMLLVGTAITGVISVMATLGVGVLVLRAGVTALGLSFSAAWAAGTLGLTLLIPIVLAGVQAVGGFTVVLSAAEAGFTVLANSARVGFNNVKIAINEAIAKTYELAAATLEVIPGGFLDKKAQEYRFFAQQLKNSTDELIEKNQGLQESYNDIFEGISAERAAEKVRAAEEAIAEEKAIARAADLERRVQQDEADQGYEEQKRSQRFQETAEALAAQRELEVAELTLLRAQREKFNGVEILQLQKKINDLKKVRDKGRTSEQKAEFKHLDQVRVQKEMDQANKLESTKDYLKNNLDATVNAGKLLFGESSAIAKLLFGVQQASAFATSLVETAKGVSIALGSAPPPINFALAAAVGAAGAIQSAAIAATAIQGFETGGLVGRSMGARQGDRHPAMLSDG